MLRYALKRLVSLTLSLFVASAVIFFVIEVIPGDPAAYMMGLNVSEEAVAAVRTELGLDRPAAERYFAWLWGMAQGDFGVSYTYRVPVAELIWDRILVSLPLTIYALALVVLIALPAGIAAASNRGGPIDLVVMGATQVGIALPNFWFGMMLVIIFSVTLRLFSAGGFAGWDAGLWAVIVSLTLPAIALALPQASILTRVTRSAILDTLDEDYVRTARAKGLTRRQALWRHAMRNALIPVVTLMGLMTSFLIAGAIIIENVFFLPGLGRLIFQAVAQRDLIVVESVVMLVVAVVIVISFTVDMVYAWVDPRLRRR